VLSYLALVLALFIGCCGGSGTGESSSGSGSGNNVYMIFLKDDSILVVQGKRLDHVAFQKASSSSPINYSQKRVYPDSDGL
jgi:hypothetical protein